jgi:hypothetical protein
MGFLGSQCGAEAEGYQFYLSTRVGVAIAAVVFLVEVGEQIVAEREIEFVSLAAVAEVNAALIVNISLPGFVMKVFRGLFLQRLEFLH